MIYLLMQDGEGSKAEQVLSKVFQVLDEKYPDRAFCSTSTFFVLMHITKITYL